MGSVFMADIKETSGASGPGRRKGMMKRISSRVVFVFKDIPAVWDIYGRRTPVRTT